MQHKKKQNKDNVIHVRVTDGLKQLVARMAKEDHRSLSNFLQWLILQEASRRVTPP